jgi:hypothetical protein
MTTPQDRLRGSGGGRGIEAEERAAEAGLAKVIDLVNTQGEVVGSEVGEWVGVHGGCLWYCCWLLRCGCLAGSLEEILLGGYTVDEEGEDFEACCLDVVIVCADTEVRVLCRVVRHCRRLG